MIGDMGPYGWVETLEAYCFTAVVGLERDEAVRRLGGDPGAAQPRTFAECFWAVDGPQWAQVEAVDGGVLVAEHNGWQGEEAAEELSHGARLACFFRNVQAVMHFVYAVDGRLVADFDPLLDRPDRLGSAPEGLPFGLFGAETSALSLLERLTGVCVRRTWLESPQRSFALPALGPSRQPPLAR
jgi:hypothetical protein